MKFSIVTCTWNSDPFLQQSIESVLSQDYPNVEHIFVDGGSTDGTLDCIRSLSGDVKLVTGITGGISIAMNAGIEIARGDVVAHLHSDDYYLHPQVLSHVEQVFKNTDAEWLFGRCLSDIDGQRFPENYVVPQYSYKRLLKTNFIPHPATFVKKRLFHRAGVFDISIRYAMDYDMWLRLGKLAEPIQLDAHLAVFRRHSGSLSTSNQLIGFRENHAVRMKHTGRSPWALVYHLAHFFVRRQRLLARLKQQGEYL